MQHPKTSMEESSETVKLMRAPLFGDFKSMFYRFQLGV